MGRKGNWFRTVKKALSSNLKRKKEQTQKQKQPSSDSTNAKQITLLENVKLTCVENEERCNAWPDSASNSTAMATSASEANGPAATQFVQHITVTQFTKKSQEEMAAIKIQSVFRGYLARSEMRTLRGLLRLKSLIESSVVNRQATSTLRCMQVLARVHFQIRSRRLRKLEENQALQKKLLQKHAKESEILQVGKEWIDSTQTKEQIEAKLLSKHEAAMRRERALAYAFSQQKTWRNSSRSINPLFTDPNHPTWGWSWLERWTAAQQCGNTSCGVFCGEIKKADAPFELSSEANSSTASRSESQRYTFQPLSTPSTRRSVTGAKKLKPLNTRKSLVPDDDFEADTRFELSLEENSPTARQSESHSYTFPLLSTPSRRRSIAMEKDLKPSSSSTRKSFVPYDDCKNVGSIRSEGLLRHSIGGPGPSVRDDESQTSSPTLPSYMTFTESARAKSRMQSPFGTEKIGARERTSFSSAMKQLLHPLSPSISRRYSERLKVDIAA